MSDERIPSEAQQAEWRAFAKEHKEKWPNTPSWTTKLLDWVDALEESIKENHAKGGLTAEEVEQACRNIGYDLTCGACACQFFTGSNPYAHTCVTLRCSACGGDGRHTSAVLANEREYAYQRANELEAMARRLRASVSYPEEKPAKEG